MKATLFLFEQGQLKEKKEFPTMAKANEEKRKYLKSFHITERVKKDIQAYIKTS